jgi:hypothetical protein
MVKQTLRKQKNDVALGVQGSPKTKSFLTFVITNVSSTGRIFFSFWQHYYASTKKNFTRPSLPKIWPSQAPPEHDPESRWTMPEPDEPDEPDFSTSRPEQEEPDPLEEPDPPRRPA